MRDCAWFQMSVTVSLQQVLSLQGARGIVFIYSLLCLLLFQVSLLSLQSHLEDLGSYITSLPSEHHDMPDKRSINRVKHSGLNFSVSSLFIACLFSLDHQSLALSLKIGETIGESFCIPGSPFPYLWGMIFLESWNPPSTLTSLLNTLKYVQCS